MSGLGGSLRSQSASVQVHNYASAPRVGGLSDDARLTSV